MVVLVVGVVVVHIDVAVVVPIVFPSLEILL